MAVRAFAASSTRRTTSSRVSLVALAFVYAATTIFWLCDAQPWQWMDSGINSGLFKTLIWVVPTILVVMALHGRTLLETFDSLGLAARPLSGLAFGILATLPMGVTALASGVARSTTDFFVGAVVLGPFAEEVLFRGFLFQELWRRAQWPAGWAAGVSAIAFGAAHVTGPSTLWFWAWVAIFGPNTPGVDPQYVALARTLPAVFPYLVEPILQLAMPAIAGTVFAWVLFRTKSLWTAIGLHSALNFWSVVSHGPAMRIPRSADPTSIAQGVSLVLAVVLVEWQWRRQRRLASTSVPHP